MHDPAILFLDEPTSGLDAVSRNNLWQYLQQVRREQATTIFLTTHYIEEAEGADHVCIVNHGKIVLHATPQEMKQNLLDRYVLVNAADQEELEAELATRGIAFTNEEEGLRVYYQEPTPQTLISQLQTPLSLLKVYEPSLEEAYVDLIGEAS
jgi:ABC-2 type transport system ATP-binding protein